MDEHKELIKDGILSLENSEQIKKFERDKAMSVHWELRTILYLGILLLLSGIGILVYQNIDTIGHTVIIVAIAAGCGACFYYGTKNRQPYSNDRVKYESPLFDYIILLGCLLFGLFIAYIQYQYTAFGSHYGLATVLPAILFFAAAYLFDHKGALSLGITGLVAWAGIVVTPSHLLEQTDFESASVILTSLLVGATLAIFSLMADKRGIKKHFGFTYNNFACNVLCIALLAYLFNDNMPGHYVAFVLLGGVAWFYIRYAITEHSFWFLLLAVIYGYIGLTYVVFSLMSKMGSFDTGLFMLAMMYIIFSGIGIVYFFINHKRILNIKS